MITAIASDYRSVYYVNLDENDGVCYRGDPTDSEQTVPGIHFPYLERFTWYAGDCVTEKYREGFIAFIDPDTVREALATEPIISYRYLARRDGREYYEMLRMAGVRRAEERKDHLVHAVGLGFTIIDAEMRESMAKNEACRLWTDDRRGNSWRGCRENPPRTCWRGFCTSSAEARTAGACPCQ